MSSPNYVVRNLWKVAPVVKTNLVSTSLVDAAFNATLAKAAVAAFDEHRAIRSGGCGTTISTPSSSESKGSTRRRRRRRATTLQDQTTIITTAPVSKQLQLGGGGSTDELSLTENDHFFQHQKTRGYRHANPYISDCECAEQLQEVLIVDAVAYYLDTVCGAKPLADALVAKTGESSIDMWAAVQQGKGAYHADHVHEGALVSGVYYAAVPSGSAPLVLHRPKNYLVGIEESETEGSRVEMLPTEGDLVLFPPWMEHSVPVLDEAQLVETENLPRVSFAFNLTGAFGFGDDLLWTAEALLRPS